MTGSGASDQIYYILSDALGSSRVITDSSGTVCFDADYFPFGAEIAEYTSTCYSNYKFAGKERDPESGLDNSAARYYSSQLARFMIPDPSSILLANFADPQQLNLYSYVRNDPTGLIDPTGLDIQCHSLETATLYQMNPETEEIEAVPFPQQVCQNVPDNPGESQPNNPTKDSRH